MKKHMQQSKVLISKPLQGKEQLNGDIDHLRSKQGTKHPRESEEQTYNRGEERGEREGWALTILAVEVDGRVALAVPAAGHGDDGELYGASGNRLLGFGSMESGSGGWVNTELKVGKWWQNGESWGSTVQSVAADFGLRWIVVNFF